MYVLTFLLYTINKFFKYGNKEYKLSDLFTKFNEITL